MVVDVQGAVAEPGVRQLPAGSRIADAIAAAGGYAPGRGPGGGGGDHQPRAGARRTGSRSGCHASATSQVAGGAAPTAVRRGRHRVAVAAACVNLNTATPEELEALPGIGPVTVQKIVAARQEQPFASLDDAVQRGVINRGQLEDIQGVATAG